MEELPVTKKRTLEDVRKDILEKAIDLFEKRAEKKRNSEVKMEEEIKSAVLSNKTPKKSYKSYTKEQKETVLSLIYSNISYAEIERKFGVDEATQRKWVKTGAKEDGRKKWQDPCSL